MAGGQNGISVCGRPDDDDDMLVEIEGGFLLKKYRVAFCSFA